MQSIRTVYPPIELPERLVSCFPIHLTDAVRRSGAPVAEEIRLHRGRIATVTATGRNYPTGVVLNEGEINEILHRMCAGSLYAHRQSINQGYLAMEGGIRVGVCGSAALEGGQVIGVSEITGLIVRIPHRQRVNAHPIVERLQASSGRGILIYAPPGVGKTTLLRTVAMEASSGACARRTVVVDTREELAWTLDGTRLTLDVLVGYPRDVGIEIAVRSMGAELIVCDEIGGGRDARAILSAANCGVPLIATAHASSVEELLRRPALKLLHDAEIFGTYVGITRDRVGGFSYRFTDRATLSYERSIR